MVDKLTAFSFVASYSVVDKNSNPLITGDLKDFEIDRNPRKDPKQLLHLDLYDLVRVKKNFEEEGVRGAAKDLTLDQFVTAFADLVGSAMKQQLSYLFMKIDCNSDGHVTWDELLTYVMSQHRNASSADLVDRQYMRVELPECSGSEAHRDVATSTLFVPKADSYVSAGKDGTLRVWTTQLRHELTIHVSERGITSVNEMCLLAGTLAKLCVAGNDRVLTFYETADLAGAPRWSVHGRMQLKDMPLSLCGFLNVADDASCLAVGTDAGTILIYDAKKLLHMLKDDRVRAEALRGLVPALVCAKALILTLPLHRDWVTALAYEDGLGALVSASLDSHVHVTQLDWPAAAVPSSMAAKELHHAGGEPQVADPMHCRNMCSMRAHAKGVTGVQLMQLHGTSRRMVATCAYERRIHIWNVETGDLLKTLEGHRGLLKQMTFDPHSQILMSLAQDGEVRFWDIITYAQLQIIKPAHVMEATTSVRFNPHHQALVTTTNRLGLWQHPRKVATDEVLHATLLAPSGHRHPLVAVLYSFQFYLVVSGDESGTICVWDVRTGVQVFRFELGCGLASMALDSSGRKLLTGAVDGTVTLWNFSSGQRLKVISTPEMHALEVSGLAHVQLAKLAYFVSVGWQSDGVADVWMWPDREKSESMNQPRRLPGHTDDILSVAFCLPNYLCTGAYDGAVLVHNCESAALHRRVQISTPPPGSQRARAATLAGGFGQRVEKTEPQQRAGAPQDLLAAVLGGVGTGTGTGAGAGANELGRSGSGEEAPVQVPTSTLLRSVAIEALDVLDAARRVLPDAVLVAGAADGYLRLWSVRAMTLLGELRVCLSESDGLLSVCTEPSATLLLCADSAGRIYVYDVSDMAAIWDAWTARGAPVPASGAPALDTAEAVQPLYTWRAHTHAITQLAYLTGVEGVLSASVDCTVRLWTLSGEQVGVFGQGAPWVFEARSSWFDAYCHALDGADHDRVRASEERLEGLLPQAQAARAKQQLDASQRGSKGGKKASVYRLPTETLSALSLSVAQLGVQHGGAKGGGIAGGATVAAKALSGGGAGMGESNYAVTNKLTAGLRQPLKPHEPIPTQERSAVLAAALVGEGADAVAPTGLSYHKLTKGTLWSNPAVPGRGLAASASAPGGLTRPGTAEPPLSASLSWLSTAGNKRPARLNTPTPLGAGSKPRPAKLAPL